MAHDHRTLKFPDGFLWGAGNSAFQVEGNNTNSDWWEWEQKKQSEDKRSGRSADHYNLYDSDFQLFKDLGHNTHRLSLEWSRIEPSEGVFDQAEIEHYRRVLQSLKSKGFVVMLTLHHFSNPLWFAKKGGWESFSSPKRFDRYVKRVTEEFKDLVDLWITINEPTVYSSLGYITQEFPPQKKSYLLSTLVMWNMARAHKKAYKSIHKIKKDAKVAIANPVQSFEALHQHSLREHLGVIVADFLSNHLFYFLTGMKTQDFIALNYYQNWYIGKKKGKFLPQASNIVRPQIEVTDLGWEVHPDGIFDVIMDFADDKKPIYITENGIASSNDDRRVRYLISYIKEIFHAIQMGADVRGYYYWSSTDNMELHRGFEPKFGLVEIDFKTLKRTPRPSAHVYQKIIENNGIPHKILKLLGHGLDVEKELKEL